MYRHLSLFLLLLSALPILAQRYTISGYITDAESGERLIGASVYDTVSHQGVATNNAGFYTLTLPAGEHVLQVSYVGYHSSRVCAILLKSDTICHFVMRSSARLEEVEVVGRQSVSSPNSVQMSTIEVPVSQIKNIPAIGGEVDVLKAIQLFPGVQSGSEGSAGMYVSGGGPDENLIMLDGVPLYNVSHAMGMFSVFNADAIKNVTLYKGNFPARFGSRLSSVIDVRQNDGNSSFWHGGITVGLIAAKMNVEGPIFSKAQLDSLKQGLHPRAKTTFNLSARRTYFDLFTAPIIAAMAKQEDGKATGGYYFYDVNAKLSHTFSEKDRLSASFYMGDDAMYMRYGYKERGDYNAYSEDKIGMRFVWGNILAATRWEHQINLRLYSNLQLSYTRYQYKLTQSLKSVYTDPAEPEGNFWFDQSITYSSQIHDVTLQSQFDYSPSPKHDMKFGGAYSYHQFRPSVANMYFQEQEGSTAHRTDTTFSGRTLHGHEASLFFEDIYFLYEPLYDSVPEYEYIRDDYGRITDSVFSFIRLVEKSRYLYDAQVRMRGNSGQWFALAYNPADNRYRSTDILSENDVVDIEVNHSVYGTASSTQVVPQKPDVQVVNQRITNRKTVEITLRLGAYSGDPSSVIAISVPHGNICYSYMEGYGYGYGYGDGDAETVCDTTDLDLLYSQSPLFGELSNRQTAGCYGVSERGMLFIPTSKLSEPQQVTLLLEHYRPISDEAFGLYTDSLCIRVAAYTYDYYIYRKSIGSGRSYLPSPPSLRGDLDDDFDFSIDDVLDGLGEQEKVQVYTNIQGGVGHFTVFSSQEIDIQLSDNQ